MGTFPVNLYRNESCGGLLEIASGVEMGEILNFVDICNLTS